MKPIYWIGSSEKDMSKLPKKIQADFFYGLFAAAEGKKYLNSKPLKGFGSADVIELIEKDAAGTYRTVYTVKMAKAIFVLHVFQKKSKQGIATPKKEIDLIKSRLKLAQEIYKENF